MSWSLGEIRALSIKAARGAGMSWGLAEEAGFAVHWLQARGAAGVTALANYLVSRTQPNTAIDQPSIKEEQVYSPITFCPIALGTAILDSGLEPHHACRSVFQPILLIPFLASINDSHIRQLSYQGNDVLISTGTFELNHSNAPVIIDKADFTLSIAHGEIAHSSFASRVPSALDSHIETLEKLAATTYAPATEASRLTGAGAGIADTD